MGNEAKVGSLRAALASVAAAGPPAVAAEDWPALAPGGEPAAEDAARPRLVPLPPSAPGSRPPSGARSSRACSRKPSGVDLSAGRAGSRRPSGAGPPQPGWASAGPHRAASSGPGGGGGARGASNTDEEDMCFALENMVALKMKREALFGDTNIDHAIHSLPVFQGCRHSFVEAVLLLMRKAIIRPGQCIVDEGAHSPNSMFLLLCGSVDVIRHGDLCRTLKEGSCFGVAQMLGISPTWEYRVQAQSACMLAELPRHSINATIQAHPEEAKYFGGILQWRCRWQAEQDEHGWKALWHCAALRGCSPAFLKELEPLMERAVYFPGEEISHEGDEDQSLVILDRGALSVEISGRVVRMEEVPVARVRLAYSEDLGLQIPVHSRSRPLSSGTSHSGSQHAVGFQPGEHFLWPADAADDKSGGHSQHEEEDLPEAALIGEETLLGTCKCRSATLRASKMCGVRILQRALFLRVLAKYPSDQAVVGPFLGVKHEEVFPLHWVTELSSFRDTGCSKAFFEFLQAHVEHRIFASGQFVVVDSLRKHVHPPLPDTGNLSVCRINRGAVQLCTSGRIGKKKFLGATEETELFAGTIILGDVFWKKHIKVLETCYASILHRGVVARALEELQADRELFVPVLLRAHESKLRAARTERVTKILNDRSIFSENSQDFLQEVIKHGQIRVFMPGDRIIEQDTLGMSMFILWAGKANVVKEHDDEGSTPPVRVLTNLGTLTHGSVFGELVMLGMQPKRTASIIASSACCTWEVEQKQILPIFERHPAEKKSFMRLMEEQLRNQAAPRIMYHPLFTCFHQQFRTFIGQNCDKKLFFPGEVVIEEGTIGDRLYIMNLGSASVELHHQHVLHVKGGSHFGFPMLCRDTDDENRYPVTLKSETMCQVLIVSRAIYQHALYKYPDMREVARALESEERQRARSQRESFAQVIERRNGMRCIIDALRGSLFGNQGDQQPSNRTMLEAAFHAWHGQVLRSILVRREEEEVQNRNSRRIEEWLLRRRTQLAQVKPRLELKALIDENLSSRGPLKYAKRITCVNEARTSQVFASRDLSDSPYLLPSPIWRRPSATASTQRSRLPPITAKVSVQSEQSKADERAESRVAGDSEQEPVELDESALCEVPRQTAMVLSPSAEELHRRMGPATASLPGSLVIGGPA